MSAIESVLVENRVFEPSAQLVKSARISGMDAYRALCAEAERSRARLVPLVEPIAGSATAPAADPRADRSPAR